MTVQLRGSGMAAISTAGMSTSQYYQDFDSGIMQEGGSIEPPCLLACSI